MPDRLGQNRQAVATGRAFPVRQPQAVKVVGYGAGMDSRHGERALLRPDRVRDDLLQGTRLWSEVRVVEETGSTNEDLIAAARAGADEGLVLVAERQTRGRGRLGRSWQSEPGSSLTFSVLLRPVTVPPVARGWLPLLAGVAVAAGIRAMAGLDVSLKWPNDVLARARNDSAGLGRAGHGSAGNHGAGKLAGILAEQAGDAIVLGTGLNVAGSPDGLPGAATSLAELGAAGQDREALLVAILRELEHWYLRWAAGEAPGDAVASGLRSEYLRSCATVGRDVRVELPGGGVLAGRACDVDGVGRLIVAGPGGVEAVSAGDVVHVR
jgi:BirA family transcriptional regulator, biotin operon repressor / biotin---[acetyl-CoA-carboxylase] ligase